MRYLVIDPTVSNFPFGPFNSESDAEQFIEDRELGAAGVMSESQLDPEMRMEKALVWTGGTWQRED